MLGCVFSLKYGMLYGFTSTTVYLYLPRGFAIRVLPPVMCTLPSTRSTHVESGPPASSTHLCALPYASGGLVS